MSKPGEYELLRQMVQAGLISEPPEEFWREWFPEKFAGERQPATPPARFSRDLDQLERDVEVPKEPGPGGLTAAERHLADRLMRHWLGHDGPIRYAASQYQKRKPREK
jgi:hypothetical protein